MRRSLHVCGETALLLVWACSSAWLERTPDKREVGGSSPPRPTNHGAVAQLVERCLCKADVVGSIPSSSTMCATSVASHTLRSLRIKYPVLRQAPGTG
jgi:hypothetical protein